MPSPQRRAAGGEPEPSLPPEISPLTTLEELLGYERAGWGQGFAPARPLPFVAAPFPPLKSRLLVCHDYAGGYGEDRLVQGGGYDCPYRMYDWGLVDIFVYFRWAHAAGHVRFFDPRRLGVSSEPVARRQKVYDRRLFVASTEGKLGC